MPVYPSGAMFPNSGSPEAATMRSWQPRAPCSLQPPPTRDKLNKDSAELFTQMTGERGTQKFWGTFPLASTSVSGALVWLAPPQRVQFRVVEESGF